MDACLDYIFPKYLPYDGAVCEDIRITDNVFENVMAGVGSHSMIFERPYRNITVEGNTFRDVRKRAVWFLNYVDAAVINNDMENVGCGVVVRTMHGKNTHVISEPVNGAVTLKAGIRIENNRITTSARKIVGGSIFDSYGVSVAGTHQGKNDMGIPAGFYGISDVSVTGNIVCGYGTGIQLNNTERCRVADNHIQLSKPDGYLNEGIWIKAAGQNRISGNIITGAGGNGIYASGTGTLLLMGNQCEDNGKSGIVLYRTNVKALRGNVLKANGSCGINASFTNVRGMKANYFEGNGTSYSIRVTGKSRGIANLGNIKCSTITSRTRTVSGKAIGSKTISLYRQYKGRNVLLQKAPVKLGKYRAAIRKLKKGSALVLIAADRYKNTVTLQTKTK